jgi:hypothetical protein
MLEVEDVAQVGAPPLVDRLVRVADHAQVPVARRQTLNQQVLRTVRILVFVDHQVPELLAVLVPDVLGFLE